MDCTNKKCIKSPMDLFNLEEFGLLKVPCYMNPCEHYIQFNLGNVEYVDEMFFRNKCNFNNEKIKSRIPEHIFDTYIKTLISIITHIKKGHFTKCIEIITNFDCFEGNIWCNEINAMFKRYSNYAEDIRERIGDLPFA